MPVYGIPETLAKLRTVRARVDAHRRETGRTIHVEVDGGVKIDNIRAIAEAGGRVRPPHEPRAVEAVRSLGAKAIGIA